MNGDWNGRSVSDVFGDNELNVGYVNGWLHTSQNLAKILIVLSFVIIAMVAPVFSGEYSGVDQIILTSRFGKSKCAAAKAIASLLAILLVTNVAISFHFFACPPLLWQRGLR